VIVLTGLVTIWKFVRVEREDGPDENVLAVLPDSDAKTLTEATQRMSGRDSRPNELPGWALVMRVPWRDYPTASSWIGGAPRAPAGFVWPREADGTPMHFLAQIDLAALDPEPQTGRRAPGLPLAGALLVFIGRSYAVRIIDADLMAQACDCTLPDDIGSLGDYGFFVEGPAFHRWPIDPMPFLGGEGERPGFFADRPAHPDGWITTWGLAAFEARLVLQKLELALDAQKLGGAVPPQLVDQAPNLRESLTGLIAEAASHDPASRVNADRLRAVFSARQSLADTLASHTLRGVLEGDTGYVWNQLTMAHRDLRDFDDFVHFPEEFHPFAEAMITDWREHRLFGLEPVPEDNFDNLDGMDILIALRADPLLGTSSEHEYGLGVWCRRIEMAEGRFDNGVLQRFSAV